MAAVMLWCERKHGHGRQLPLAACVATECRMRDRCKSYKAVEPNAEAAAMRTAVDHGHAVHTPRMPLLEVANG